MTDRKLLLNLRWRASTALDLDGKSIKKLAIKRRLEAALNALASVEMEIQRHLVYAEPPSAISQSMAYEGPAEINLKKKL